MKYRLLLVLTAAIWGFAFVAQLVAMDDIGPLTFSACRSFIGALSLVPVLLLTQPARSPREPRYPRWVAILIAGLFLTGGTLCQQFGLLYTTASKASFITASYLLMVPLFGLFLGQALHRNHIIGAVLAMAGVYLLSVTEALHISRGDGLVFLGALCFTGHILYLNDAAQRYSPIQIAAGQFFVFGLISLAGTLLFETVSLPALLRAWWPILYTGVFSTGVAYTLQVVGQKHLPPTECSMILSLEMVFGGLGGFLFLGETMSSRELTGVVCMIIGVFLSQLSSPEVFRLRRRSDPSSDV